MPDSSAILEDAFRLSVVVPVFNGSAYLSRCLAHIRACSYPYLECIVADDGSTDDSADIAKAFGCTVVSTGGRRGPAFARNLAVRSATGKLLVFIDADVCVNPSAFDRLLCAFRDDDTLEAIIGSYDDEPGASGLLSQYRNLMHCYVHQHGKRRASTFWTGFGAIRRATFLEAGGFDESYARPSVEDIELGYRLFKSGVRLALDPAITVKHLKRWTLPDIIRTDILDRGIPWAELIVRERMMPNDLNLKMSQRLSVLLMALLIPVGGLALRDTGTKLLLMICLTGFLLLSGFFASVRLIDTRDRLFAIVTLGAGVGLLAFPAGLPWVIPAAAAVYPLMRFRRRLEKRGSKKLRAMSAVIVGYLALTTLAAVFEAGPEVYLFAGILAAVILLNLDFYRFLARRMGGLEAIAAIPFHLLFHFYSGFSMVAGVLKYMLYPRTRKPLCGGFGSLGHSGGTVRYSRPCLGLPETPIESLRPKQVAMSAAFGDAPMIEQIDPVRVYRRSQTVGNQNSHNIPRPGCSQQL